MTGIDQASINRTIVLRFWALMASNDFKSVEEVCEAGFTVDWPQSRERIRGIDAFGQLNHEYPAHGPWTFEVRRIVAGDQEVVTETDISDGVQHARAVSFFGFRAGRIASILEYWPDPFAAPKNRAHLVEPSPLALPQA